MKTVMWCLIVGVAISNAVAGVAVGVVTRQDDGTDDITDYRLLTDLLVRNNYNNNNNLIIHNL